MDTDAWFGGTGSDRMLANTQQFKSAEKWHHFHFKTALESLKIKSLAPKTTSLNIPTHAWDEVILSFSYSYVGADREPLNPIGVSQWSSVCTAPLLAPSHQRQYGPVSRRLVMCYHAFSPEQGLNEDLATFLHIPAWCEFMWNLIRGGRITLEIKRSVGEKVLIKSFV